MPKFEKWVWEELSEDIRNQAEQKNLTDIDVQVVWHIGLKTFLLMRGMEVTFPHDAPKNESESKKS